MGISWVWAILVGLIAIAVSRLASKWQKATKPQQSGSASRATRKRVRLPMLIDAPFNQTFSVSTYDISTGGAFIGFGDLDTSMNRAAIFGTRAGIKIGDSLKIKILAGRFERIYCEGKVVRMEQSSIGDYPDGLGIEFTSISKKNSKKLKTLVQMAHRFAEAA